MSDTHSDTPDDLSTLAWVLDELRHSLEAAHKALRRFVKESEASSTSDVDGVDPAILRTALQQIHQGVGALELIGFSTITVVLRASEAAVKRFILKPKKVSLADIDVIEQASFALLDYLQRLLTGQPTSALALFPRYRAVQVMAGAERVHPADLWSIDWQWRDVAAEDGVVPHRPDAQARAAMEPLMLMLMRGQTQSAAMRMSDVCACLGAGAPDLPASTLWKLAAGFFESQALGLLQVDLFGKRVASRLLGQLRIFERGETLVSGRLAQDLLFFCAQSAVPADVQSAPRLMAVRKAYDLLNYVPVDYDACTLGRFDPALIAQAKKRVAGAKDAWSGVAGGELHRLGGLSEQFSLVGDVLKRLYPSGELLADELMLAVAETQQSRAAPATPLAMEVATCVLFLESSLDDAGFDHPDQAQRVHRLAQRVASVRAGHTPDPLEVWMEELYRRVSDRQTMGSVVQELRASLTGVEKQIDQYFRDPAATEAMASVPGELSSMKGVLSVLGVDHAVQALTRMREDVDGLLQLGAGDVAQALQSGVLDRLAGNLGALGFLIDMLAVQPHVAKSLFVFDPQQGLLSPLMGRSAAARSASKLTVPDVPTVEPRLMAQALSMAATDHLPLYDEHVPQAAPEQAADAGAADALRVQPSDALAQFASSASDPVGLEPVLAPTPAPSITAPTSQDTDLADDPEMLEIFVEEAREKVAEARSALVDLAQASGDVGLLTVVRRAFHTFKGSSRMVGLKEFGNASWACEQLYNTWLSQQESATPELLDFSSRAIDHLAQWIEAIANRQAASHRSAPLEAAAAAFGRGEKVGEIRQGVSTEPVLPSMSLTLGSDVLPMSAPAPVASPLKMPGIDFDLELNVVEADVLVKSAAYVETELSEIAPDTSLQDALTAPAAFETIELNLGAPDAQAPETIDAAASSEDGPHEDPFKVVGSLRISIPLFNIYLNEADELSRKLSTEVAEWEMELHRPVGEMAASLAHSLAGSSATVGFADLSHLARLFEHALLRSQTLGSGTAEEGRLFVDAAEEIRRLLHQFAAGFLMTPSRQLLDRLAEHEISSAKRLEQANAAIESPGAEDDFLPVPDVIEASISDDATLDMSAQGADSGALPPDAPAVPASSAMADRLTQPAELGSVTFKAFVPLASAEAALISSTSAGSDNDAKPDNEDDDIDAVDAVDAELFPIFEEEAQELLPQLDGHLREWSRVPGDHAHAASCMRTLHTLKGGARLAGAMRLGEMAHRLETAIEHVLAQGESASKGSDIALLQARSDALTAVFEALRARDARAYEDAGIELDRSLESVPAPTVLPSKPAAELKADAAVLESLAAVLPQTLSSVEATPRPDGAQALDDGPGAIDWSRFSADAVEPAAPKLLSGGAANSAIRVRGPLLERMVNQAGEVSITRSRIESEVGNIRGSLYDLTDNLERLRQQLRDIEFQAETQMLSRQEAAKAAHEIFDPLESDRFTRFQELTRMMAESVNDVATVQRSLQRTLETTEDELASQARLTRDLQDDLLRTRMIEFESLSDRLYRVVRQAAKETGKQVRLDIIGGSIEIDRGVLDRMTPAFEHLLRNCVTHGIEPVDVRTASAKDPVGSIVVVLRQEGNEVAVEFRDDGAGLNLQGIREKGLKMGLIQADSEYSDSELANLIFAPGFTTAALVTELSGRGVGMDVVRSEVNSMGGRIETATATGLGTSFKLVLPLTTAVTQIVMVRCGSSVVAVPCTLIEIVRRATASELEQAYQTGAYAMGERSLLFFWFGSLLQQAPVSQETGRTRTVIIVRSAQQRIALHVDEVLGTQEAVVKNLGPQLSRLPGLAGMTLLASGAVALIYNPVALATLYGDAARAATQAARMAPSAVPSLPTASELALRLAPLVLVVDDSLTVRRVTQRLLIREGFRVLLAKDGIEALERLAEDVPHVVLSDIEMPRMDGFDLARNIRADARLRHLPIIMITSRIAQKHRDHAAELGVNHYLGKPYSEDDLLALITRYTHEVSSSN